MIIPPPIIREVHGLTDEQRTTIGAFLQGAIYCWCKNRPGEWFSLRDLMGGENVLWNHTPLDVLCIRRKNQGKQAFRAAAVDAGRLMRHVIHDDRRMFEARQMNTVFYYRWTGDENLVTAAPAETRLALV